MSSQADVTVWTIGHSKHEIDTFLSLLKVNQIEVLVDVRTSPYSRMAPQFNQSTLVAALEQSGIKYLHLGAELGGRPEADHMYDEKGHVFYNLVADTEIFQNGIQRLIEGINLFRVAVMCSEGNPAGCHRTLLVGRVLQQFQVKVINILPDGKLEELPDLNMNSIEQTLFGDIAEVKEWKSAVSVRQATQQKDSLDY